MRIMPTGLNQNIKGVNKNKTANSNTAKQNPIKSTQHNDILNISFNGQKKTTFGNDTLDVFQPTTLSKDENGQNIIHKMFLDILKNYADEMRNFNISEIDNTKNIQDIYDKCNFDFKSEKKINDLSSTLKNKSPETIEKALLAQDKNGQTPLHFLSFYNMKPYIQIYGLNSAFEVSTNAMTSDKKSKNNPANNAYSDLIYTIFGSLGDIAPKTARKALLIKDIDGNTPLERISKEPLKVIIDILGENAPSVLEEATLIQNKYGLTPWNNATDGVTSIYVDTLGNRAHDVVKKAMHVKNKYRTTLLHSATLEQMKAYKKALKNDTKEEFRELITVRDKFGHTPLKYITDDRLKFLIGVFGDDAPKIIKKSLLLKDSSGRNQLYETDKKTKAVYKELFGDEYNEITKKSEKIDLMHRILNKYT